jgi:DNA-binding XRE family transcriptional regulator
METFDNVASAQRDLLDAYLRVIREKYGGLSRSRRYFVLGSLEKLIDKFETGDFFSLEGESPKDFDGEKAKKIRLLAGLTQKELAGLMGYNSHQSISNLETGSTIPSNWETGKLRKYFSWLLDNGYECG